MHCLPLAVKTSWSGSGDQSSRERYSAETAACRLRADGGRVSQREIEHFGPFQSFQASGDHRRLRRQNRIIDFEIDARAARFGRHGDAAPRFAGNERAAPDFADHEAAAQQLGIDPARGRDRDLALIGKAALRRQPVAGLERAIGDLGGNGIGKLQIFELRHYCTESNVLLAPRNVSDHLKPIKPAIALREVQAIRASIRCRRCSQRLRQRHRFAVRKPTGEE